MNFIQRVGLSTGKWTLSRCVFCCFNAFTGEDIRVEAAIPGSVRCYKLSAGGSEKQPASVGDWAQVFVSSCLRSMQALQQTDNMRLRCLDMFYDDAEEGPKLEGRFLELAETLYGQGWKLGTDTGSHTTDSSNNLLARIICDYYLRVCRPQVAVAFFERVIFKYPRCVDKYLSTLAADHQISRAIQFVSNKISFFRDHNLNIALGWLAEHILQNYTLYESDEVELAVKESVKRNPGDINSWLCLAALSVKNNDYCQALTALNQASPVLYIRDSERSLQPESRIASIIKADSLDGDLLKAYKILLSIHNSIGWERLIGIRADSFLLEEEYHRSVHASYVVRAEGETGSLEKLDSEELPSQTQDPLRDSHKKICERWLDELFLCLYHDVRALRMFEGAISDQANDFSAAECLMLGRLVLRLNAGVERAKKLFHQVAKQSTDEASRAQAEIALMELYASEKRLSHALSAAIRYMFVSPEHSSNVRRFYVGDPFCSAFVLILKSSGFIQTKSALATLCKESSHILRYFEESVFGVLSSANVQGFDY
jgi:hypothetical protein